MVIIGVTGGMGAGKSRVLAYLEEAWDAQTVRLDDVSRQMLDVDGLCYEKTIDIFGREIVKPDRTLDRPLIAKKIFEDPALRDQLNNLIHPAVKEEVYRLAGEMKRSGEKLLVIEAALLIEGGYREICDEFWYIYADEETRRQRLRESRGYTDERIDGTFATQLSEEDFRAKADFVIDNSGDFAYAAQAIDSRLAALMAASQ